jgi:hypothetical protein
LDGVGVSFLLEFFRLFWAIKIASGSEILLGGVKGADMRLSNSDPILKRRVKAGRNGGGVQSCSDL